MPSQLSRLRRPPRRRLFPLWPFVLLAAGAAAWWWFSGRAPPPPPPPRSTATPSAPAPAALAPGSIVARTGPPELLRDDGDPFALRPLAERSDHTTILPADIAGDPRYGRMARPRDGTPCLIDQVGANRRLVFDENHNGDLRDDPRRWLAREPGLWELFVPGDEPLRVRVREHSGSVQAVVARYGELPLGDERRAFALLGTYGDYNASFDRVAIDLDRDGGFYVGASDGPEVFYLSEKTVNIADKSYEMLVEQDGSTLTLKLLAERQPERAALATGTAAPAFTATDLDGATVQFPRGRPTLLDFWSYTCHYCKESLPQLDALAVAHPGLDILIIADFDAESSRPDLSTIPARPNLHRLVDAKPIHDLYRVHAVPRYYLVDRDGKLDCAHCSLDEIRSRAPARLK